jgi:hypothetical protein
MLGTLSRRGLIRIFTESSRRYRRHIESWLQRERG